MRVLTLDIGNTTVDACLWEGGRLKHLGRFSYLDLSVLEGKWERVLVVSVRPSLHEDLTRAFGRKLWIVRREDIPIRVEYRTPETLGVDRVLLSYAVKEFYTDSGVVVSLGTALVVDLLLKGVFRGGFITAGIGLKLKALHMAAEGIPDLKLRDLRVLLGRSTEECVVGGIVEEVRAFVVSLKYRWEKEFGVSLPVFITGGDGQILKDLGTYDPLILHRGLLRIGGYI